MLLALVHWSFCWIWHLPRHCCVLKIGSYAYSFNEDRNLIRIMDDCTYYFCCWGCILARAYFYRSSRFDLGMSFFFSFKLFFANHKELHLFYGVYGMTILNTYFFILLIWQDLKRLIVDCLINTLKLFLVYRGFSPYATFGTWKKVALAKNLISKIFILCKQ